jgi:ABC-type phosphate transport system substrate-binding protein
MRRRFITGLFAGLTVVGVALPLCAENAGMRVIVNAANPLPSMLRDDVAKLFTGKNNKWPDGSAVLPVDLAGKTPTRRLFSTEILNKELEAVESLWQQLIFNGKAVPPPIKATEAEVVAYVKENPGAIGYISYATDLVAGVKEFGVKLK